MIEALIPRLTEKTTAYDLLTKVAWLIAEEPKRYNQDVWLSKKQPYHRSQDFAPCGTAACVAGWVDLMYYGPAVTTKIANLEIAREDPGTFAQRVLGLNDDQADELFRGDALVVAMYREPHEVDPIMPRLGTPEYAALGVKHIQWFQEKHEAQLRATVIDPKEEVKNGEVPEAQA